MPYPNTSCLDIIIGIDPGKVTTFGEVGYNKLEKILYIKPPRKFNTDNVLEIKNSKTYYKNLSYYNNNLSFIMEQVHSMPKNGVKSLFTFGESFGFIRGLISEDFYLDYVPPLTWKKYLNILNKGKNGSIEYIKSISDKICLRYTSRCKKDDHNIADAYCIAIYYLLLKFKENKFSNLVKNVEVIER